MNDFQIQDFELGDTISGMEFLYACTKASNINIFWLEIGDEEIRSANKYLLQGKYLIDELHNIKEELEYIPYGQIVGEVNNRSICIYIDIEINTVSIGIDGQADIVPREVYSQILAMI